MGSENEQKKIQVGDFVEADWVGNELIADEILKVKYRGMVTSVLSPDLVNVNIGIGNHLCSNPRIISVEDLSIGSLILLRDFLEKEKLRGGR